MTQDMLVAHHHRRPDLAPMPQVDIRSMRLKLTQRRKHQKLEDKSTYPHIPVLLTATTTSPLSSVEPALTSSTLGEADSIHMLCSEFMHTPMFALSSAILRYTRARAD